MPPKAKLKSEDSIANDGPWKSRFPVARIKKIMQADEDVGKVAQVVPVIISKALELFMESIIQEAEKHTIETGHRRVLPGHLKMAVAGNQMFDFLEDHVKSIPDPVHIEAKPVDDKRIRRTRVKKDDPRNNSSTYQNIDTGLLEEEDEDFVTEDLQLHHDKRVKLEGDGDNGARRSMSIANLMSPPSPGPSQVGT